MRLVASSKRYAIFDDYLGARDQRRVWEFLRWESYHSVHNRGWHKPFGTMEALLGSSYTADRDSAQTKADNPSPDMVMFMNSVIENSDKFTQWIGRPFRDWLSFSAQAYLYPPGTGLCWHDDGIRKGAYIYYGHPVWNLNWGGELFVGGEVRRSTVAQLKRGRSRSALTENVNPYFSDKDQSAGLDLGVWTAIQPKPNRMVILKGGTDHCVKRVEPEAGANMRASIVGLFHGKGDINV